MSRKTLLRRAGLGIGTVLVVGAGAIGYRAYDQGVLEVGNGAAYEPWSCFRACVHVFLSCGAVVG